MWMSLITIGKHLNTKLEPKPVVAPSVLERNGHSSRNHCLHWRFGIVVCMVRMFVCCSQFPSAEDKLPLFGNSFTEIKFIYKSFL